MVFITHCRIGQGRRESDTFSGLSGDDYPRNWLERRYRRSRHCKWLWKSTYKLYPLPRTVYRKTGLQRLVRDNLEKKRKEADLKPPKVEKREATLTIPLDEPHITFRKRRTFAQEESPLMRLPPELRLMIWEEYFEHEKVYVLLKKGRVTSFRVDENSLETVEGQSYYEYDHDDVSIVDITITRPKRLTLDVLPLLQTCRVIYSEAVDLLYRHVEFAFCDIFSFLGFSASLLPTRLRNIQNVYLAFHRLDTVKVIHTSELYDQLNTLSHSWLKEHISKNLEYTKFRRSTQLHFRSQLPRHDIQDLASTWDVAGELLDEMKSLKTFTMVFDKNRFNLRRLSIDENGIFGPLNGVRDRVEFERFSVQTEWRPRDEQED